ncbi:MAG: MMPL family transporter [Deltaproteobacteria bacterium]|nr:MMPL family transporter [Deltaproteobacteria bacterium]
MKPITKLLSLSSIKYPRITVILALLLAFVSLWYAKTHLKLDTNQDNLISKKQKYLTDYTDFLKEFGDWEYIYVVMLDEKTAASHKTSEQEVYTLPHDSAFQTQAKKFSAALTEKLKQRPDLFETVVNKIDLSQIKKSAILLAPQSDFNGFVDFAKTQPEVLSAFLNIRSAHDWYTFIGNVIKDTGSLADDKTKKQMEQYWPLVKHSLYAPFEHASLKALQNTNFYTLLSGQYVDEDGYLFSENGNLLFIKILPVKNYSSMEIIAAPINYLKNEISSLKLRFPAIEAGITGRPVLQNDEATSTQSDSEMAGIMSFALVAILFYVFFRSYKRSLFSLLSLLIGMSLTTGFITVVYGTINLISIVFTVILIGLGIENGIHFLLRYQKEKLLGLDTACAIREATSNTGPAIIAGATTTAIAFATAVFTDFLGLKQLGVIAGVGVMLCCLTQLTVFPAFLMLFDHSADYHSYKIPPFGRLSFLVKKPKAMLIFFFIITLIAIPFALKTGFNNNLLSLQDQQLESVRFENIIQENSDFSTWFLAHSTTDINALRQLKTRIEALPAVKNTQSILDYLPADQTQRMSLIRDHVTPGLKSIDTKHAEAGLLFSLDNLKGSISKTASDAFSSGLADEFAELNAVAEKLDSFINQIKKQTKQTPVFETQFMTVIKSAQQMLEGLVTPAPLSEKKLPPELINIYKSKNGRYALSIYPKKDIWNPDNMKEFISQVRAVIPNVTGAPITHYESANRMVSGFVLVAILTAVLVLAIVYAQFKKVGVSLFILFNLLTTFIWLAALMYFKGIQINLANFFALPVLIGSGIDNGIHAFHRYHETHSVEDLFTSTIPAVTLSCLTTICGFASLMLVKHNGLASFGLIMAVGTFLIFIASVIVLPNVICLFYKGGKENV